MERDMRYEAKDLEVFIVNATYAGNATYGRNEYILSWVDLRAQFSGLYCRSHVGIFDDGESRYISTLTPEGVIGQQAHIYRRTQKPWSIRGTHASLVSSLP